ncbi:MAG: pseudouridine-5'-phosphate glycosidase [Candidatus Marinimicrobia bacterium]|nr:pseudouridine-5'-phosphate glycosidase [Candidatus Neomarinimicrobiota bacterium]
MNSLKTHFSINPEVEAALSKKQSVLALESTIIAHGMPYPENIKFARQAETLTRKHGVTPATIAIINGKINVGLNDNQLEILASSKNVEKIAVRDIAFTVAQKLTGATTVSATMHLAHLAGIDVFATGGIGGVHRNAETTFDISQDLIELSRTPMIVVSAGVKAILDIPKTLEYLETLAVPVIGYQTNEFPAFYSCTSNCKIVNRCNTPIEIAELFKAHKDFKSQSAILVANPAPESDEIPQKIINKYINTAIAECSEKNIMGKNVTPFLLKRIVELSNGKSLKTNIALALNNVKLGSQIAKQLSKI